MVDNIRIITYDKSLRQDIIAFIKSIAIEEFGFTAWKDYLDNKDFSSYEKGESLFLIAVDENDEIVGSCGGLKVDDNFIKLNSFYVAKNMRNCKLGSRMYSLIEDFAKKHNFKQMILCTYERFKTANEFYKKQGFKLYKIEEEIEHWLLKDLK